MYAKLEAVDSGDRHPGGLRFSSTQLGLHARAEQLYKVTMLLLSHTFLIQVIKPMYLKTIER